MQPMSFLDLPIEVAVEVSGKVGVDGQSAQPHSKPKGASSIKDPAVLNSAPSPERAEKTVSATAKTANRVTLVRRMWIAIIAFFATCVSASLLAHGVAEGDANFLQSQQGFHFWPYFYLGAKHMVTGYDHLLFLAGVIFFLYRLRDVGIYVTLFALGHSLTLLAGVWFDIPANAYLIDAIIGLSVVYKGFENIGGFDRLGIKINTKLAVCVFGLFHGFGLATKLQELAISEDGLFGNLLAFNLGVEVGQLTALVGIVTVMNIWRTRQSFSRQAWLANTVLMTCGFMLIGYQLTGYFIAAA